VSLKKLTSGEASRTDTIGDRAPPYCTIRFTLLIEQSQDFWFCLYLAKLVQFLKLGIVACGPLTLFLLLPIKVNKVPKNLFGSVLPDFPVVTVVSIIAFLVTMEIVVKKYLIESQELGLGLGDLLCSKSRSVDVQDILQIAQCFPEL
jgi:hypothetical protein